MRLLIGFLLVSTLLLGNAAMASADIKQDMVEFDQALIPLWFHVYEGDMTKAKKSVFYVHFKWQQLKNSHAEASGQVEWRDAFCRTDDWLSDAYAAIHQNNSRLALNQLNHARYEMMELRRQYNIPYYLDEIWQFQEVTRSVAQVVHDEKLGLLEWNELQSMIGRMNTAWVRVRQIDWDAKDFGLDRTTIDKLRANQKRISRQLLLFNEQLRRADRQLLAETVRPLEKAALYQMRLFGKFDAFQTYYASR